VYSSCAEFARVRGTGWRRPIGCLQVQVIFRHKKKMNCKDILREMTSKEKAFCGSSPPCSPSTGWRRPTECLLLICRFLQKSTIISGSFAENDLQLEASYASSPPGVMISFSIT